MIAIAERSLMTVYANGLAVLLLAGLFALSTTNSMKRKKGYGTSLFYLLSVFVLLNAVFSSLYYSLRYQELGWSPVVRRLFPSLDELSATLVLVAWVFYAEYMIYNSRERLIRLRYFYTFPMLVVAFCTVMNPFTGWMFDVDEAMLLHYTPLYYTLEVVEHLYGFLPLVGEILYTKRFGKLHFFSVIPVVVPVFFASVFTIGSDYSVRALGFSIGLMLLFLSYASRWRFDDEESGLYNRHFLKFIMELAEAGKRDYKNVIIFKTDHSQKEFFEILKAELPKDGELIRSDEKTVILFSNNSKPSMISIIGSLVTDAVDEYNENHPNEDALDIIVYTRRRKKDESTKDFIKRVSAA